ncbi:MAG: hypothetical protein M1826_001270 [Phylliscum demangeonii]|nr:MAG: hypothetical protein M1826_001270 [Phylliscum demangeonii]
MPQARYNDEHNTPQLDAALHPLLAEFGGRWALSGDGRTLLGSFHFLSFKAAWGFMDAIAQQCMVVNHHPSWENVCGVPRRVLPSRCI